MKYFLRILFVLNVLNLPCWAQSESTQKPISSDEPPSYETVIRGTSFNSTSKVIFDQKAIQESKAPDLPSLLATQANISVVNSSFQPGAIYMRGGNASHILILVDGLPFYDPGSLDKTIDLNILDIKSIRRIEISKGAQTVLYGGQALVGVIKIETFPREIENQKYGVVEGGQRDYRKASLAAAQVLDSDQLLVGRVEFSEKNSRSPVLDSDVDYPTQNINGELGYLHRSDDELFFKVGRIDNKSKISTSDYTYFKAVDAKDFDTSLVVSSISAGYQSNQWKFRPTLHAGYQKADRHYEQPSSATDDKYSSDLVNVRLETTPVDLESVTLLAGASYSKESLVYRDISNQENANDFAEIKGVFLKGDYRFNSNVNLEAGVRGDQILKNRNVSSFQLGATLWKDWKLEYATGYRTPSLMQLYGYAPNPDLEPEVSRTLTLDYSKSLSQNQKISFSLFETLFDNLIITQRQGGGRSKNINIAKASTRGAEVMYSLDLPTETHVHFNYGYQEPWDVHNARCLLKRPLQTGSVGINQDFSKDRFLYEVVWNGERIDYYSGTTFVSLDSYVISNASWTHLFTDQISAYIRGNNIWNKRFEVSRGYFDEGAFWLAGLEIRD